MFQIHNCKDRSELDTDIGEAANIEGMNLAIKKPKKHWYSQHHETVHDLSPPMKCVLRICQSREMMDAIRFFCLDFGCQHVRAECFLACGELKLPPPGLEPRNNMCGVCNGSWADTFMPVDKEKVIRMLKCKAIVDGLSLTAKCDNIVDLLWRGTKKWWIEDIFRRKNV